MDHPSQTRAHLRVQLTVLGSGRRTAAHRAEAFRSTLRVGTHHFTCDIFPEEPLTAGGHAVHCAVAFADPGQAMPHFPAGTMFELWEGGRKGYGMVLAVTPA